MQKFFSCANLPLRQLCGWRLSGVHAGEEAGRGGRVLLQLHEKLSVPSSHITARRYKILLVKYLLFVYLCFNNILSYYNHILTNIVNAYNTVYLKWFSATVAFQQYPVSALLYSFSLWINYVLSSNSTDMIEVAGNDYVHGIRHTVRSEGL